MHNTIRFGFILVLTAFLVACGGGGGGGGGSGSGGGNGNGGGGGSTSFAIDHTVPADGSTTHDRDAPIEIHFTAAADIGSVQGNLSLTDSDDSEVAFEASLSDDGRVAYIAPLDRLARGADYRLAMEAGILPQGSGDGLAAATLEFRTSSERKARPAISLAPNHDCSGSSFLLPWVELLDDGSAYVALPKRYQDNCYDWHAPEIVTVLAEKRAPETSRAVLTDFQDRNVEGVLEPQRDPGTGNILFVTSENNPDHWLYAARAVDSATRQVGEKQVLADAISTPQSCLAHILPYDGKFHLLYRDDRSCPAGSCDSVRDYVIAPDGTPENLTAAFIAAKPGGGYACYGDMSSLWKAASTPDYLMVAYEQYLDNGYLHLRGPDYSAPSADVDLLASETGHVLIDPENKRGFHLTIEEGPSEHTVTYRMRVIDLANGTIFPHSTALLFGTGYGSTGGGYYPERKLSPWVERVVLPVLDIERKKVWVFWEQSNYDNTKPYIGEAPYRLMLNAFDYEAMAWSDDVHVIQESEEPYQNQSFKAGDSAEAALMLDADGSLLLIHRDNAGTAGGGLVLQRFDPDSGDLTPVTQLFSSCRSTPPRFLFDTARNDAGDMAVAVYAKYAQAGCESEVHEDGEHVLVRYD